MTLRMAGATLLVLLMALTSACDFATGARCRSDDNCPDAAPFCGAFDEDGIGTCGSEPSLVDAGVHDAGPHDAGGADDDAGGHDDAGSSDAGGDDAGAVDGGGDGGASDAGQLDGGSDAGPDPCGPAESDAGVFLFGRLNFPLHPITTDEDTFLVRVAAADPSRACSVKVNQTAATYNEGSSDYLVRVPLLLGDNPLEIEVMGFGQTITEESGVVVRRVPYLPSDPRGTAVAVRDGQPIVVAADHPGVLMGLVTGGAQSGAILKLSGDGVGDGPPMDSLNAVAAAFGSSTVYALNSAELYRVDINSGDRDLVASEFAPAGTGAWGDTMTALTVSDDGTAVYVYDNVDTIVAVDVSDALFPRSVAAGPGVGTGEVLNGVGSLCFHDGNLFALGVDGGGQQALLLVNLTTNLRTVVSGASNAGPVLGSGHITCSSGRQEVLLATLEGDVISIDIATGDRVSIAAAADPTYGASPRAITGLARGEADLAWMTDEENEGFIEVDLATGARTLRTLEVGSGPRLNLPQGITYIGNDGYVVVDRERRLLQVENLTGARLILSDDSKHTDGLSYGDLGEVTRTPNDSVLITDDTNKAVWEYRFNSGNRGVYAAGSNSPLSGAAGSGTGPDLQAVDDVTVAWDGTAFVTDDVNQVVYRVDTGRVRTVFNLSGFSGLPVTLSGGLAAVDAENGFVFLGDASADRILSMNPGTGAALTLTGNGVGSGDDLPTPRDVTISNQEWAYVLTGLYEDIVEVTLATGARRSVVFGSYNPEGPSLAGGTSIAADGHWGFVTSAGRNAILLVDLVTGERAVFSQ